MELIGVIVVAAGAVAFLLPVGAGIAMVILFALLQSAGAIVIPGSASIQPAHLMLAFLLVRVICDPQWRAAFGSAFHITKPGFLLLLTTVYAVLGAFFLPRVWAGNLAIYPLGGPIDFVTYPLYPANTNLTQSIYICADLAWFMLLSFFLKTRGSIRTMTLALLAYGVLNIAFAFADILTAQTSTAYLLSFMRNAAYGILAGDVVGGSKRIVGSFTEASAFAAASVGVFCFSVRLWLGGEFPRLCAAIAVVTFVLIVLSTSSTGLVALAGGTSFLYAGAAIRLARGNASGADTLFVVVLPCVAISLAAAVALNEDWLDWARSQANLLLFDKATTESGIERATLNRDAWRLFQDTYGLGVGLGSARASSFVMACLACLGGPGTFLYLTFIASIFLGKRESADDLRAVASAAGRHGCLGLLIGFCVAGLHTDLGLVFFAFAALSFSSKDAKFELSVESRVQPIIDRRSNAHCSLPACFSDEPDVRRARSPTRMRPAT